MSIKLRNLLNLTEQAPQPPLGNDPLAAAASPVPAPVAPQGMNAGGQEQQPETPAATPDTSPEPEDPSEYDFTKDFRAFEDKKNKAEADAKKVLLDKMNERLLGKTIVANASRGYGQPKTDYTIKNVKKVSVEFWYKDYVVIVSDENDKKYFLTPGINIKIEGGSEPAPGEEQPVTPEKQEEPQAQQPPQPDGQESPNAPAGAEPQAEVPQGEPQAAPETPVQQPVAPAANAEVPQEQPPKKKKKVPVAEWIQSDLNGFMSEYMNEAVKNKYGKVNFIKYVTEAKRILTEGKDVTKIKCKLLIPESHMVTPFESRDIKLSAVDYMRQRKLSGQYSKGSVDISKHGRYYLLEYVKEIGWTK